METPRPLGFRPRGMVIPVRNRHTPIASSSERGGTTSGSGQRAQSADVADLAADRGQKASPGSISSQASGAQRAVGWWGSLESRYKVIIACTASFVICNMVSIPCRAVGACQHGHGKDAETMPHSALFNVLKLFCTITMPCSHVQDKVNMSVAIIPMAQDFGWSPSVAGIVQSSFFYGYMLCQLPSGVMSSKLGGRKVLPAGVGLWSLATCSVPLLAATIPGLCISRAAVGLGEAVAPSAATDIVARVVPPNERSRAVAFVFSGLHVGSILGLLAAPPLISSLGWEAVFVSFGALGLVWCLWFENVLAEVGRTDPDVAALLVGRSAAAKASSAGAPVEEYADSHDSGGHGGVIDADMPIPWRAFLRSTPVQALMYTHFCNNWFHYTMLVRWAAERLLTPRACLM